MTDQLTETDNRLALRCIALREGALYKAVCIDLGLYVQRSTLQEAMAELETLIQSYVQDAAEVGIPREELLRPIPKAERLRLYAKLFRAELSSWIKDLIGPNRQNGSGATHETRLCYL